MSRFISAFLLFGTAVAREFADYEPSAVASSNQKVATSTFAAIAGLEWKFWQRLAIRDFYAECGIFVLLGLYVASYVVGCRANLALAKANFGAILRLLNNNFADMGIEQGMSPLLSDGPETFVSYATGRQNVDFVHIQVDTKPRHDPLTFAFRAIYGIYFDAPSLDDRVYFEFSLPAKFEPFVFGVVNKSVMRKQRASDWDLQFTKTNDYPTLSNLLVTMSESADITATVLNPETILVMNQYANILEYLVISDQPFRQPKVDSTSTDMATRKTDLRTLRLSVLVTQTTNLTELLTHVLKMIDSLPRLPRQAQVTARKLAEQRDATYKQLSKLQAEQAAEDEGGVEARRPTRKEIREKAEKERLGKLPASEQRKALEKERERKLRKQSGKMSKRA